MEEDKKNITLLFEKASKDPSVPKIYANGFANAIGNGDTTTILQQNGVPVAVLNLSYTIAKTLSLKLGALIKTIEDDTNNTIMTTNDIDNALREKT